MSEGVLELLHTPLERVREAHELVLRRAEGVNRLDRLHRELPELRIGRAKLHAEVALRYDPVQGDHLREEIQEWSGSFACAGALITHFYAHAYVHSCASRVI